SGQDDAIDRQLVANLVVSYVESRHGRHVLDLMARMLAFTDDQMIKVGLASGGGGVSGVVPGLLSALIGGSSGGSSADPPDVAPEDIHGDSLSELWVSFLLASS
ncbi:unnamed protein product, partial [Phaeothamnion confervicola]